MFCAKITLSPCFKVSNVLQTVCIEIKSALNKTAVESLYTPICLISPFENCCIVFISEKS